MKISQFKFNNIPLNTSAIILCLGIIWLVYLWFPGEFPKDFPAAESMQGDLKTISIPEYEDFPRFATDLWQKQNGTFFDLRLSGTNPEVNYPVYDLVVLQLKESELEQFLAAIKRKYLLKFKIYIPKKTPTALFYKENQPVFQIRFLKKANFNKELTSINALAESKNRLNSELKNQNLLFSLIIFDFGSNLTLADAAMQLPLNTSFAIIPGLPYSKQIAELFYNNNREILLQIPMQKKIFSENRPGKFELLIEENDSQTQFKLEKSVENLPGIQGVSNFIESVYLSNSSKTELFMRFLKQKGLFFFSGKTTNNKIAKKFSLRNKVLYFEADLFLNRHNSEKHIRQKLNTFKKATTPGRRFIIAGKATTILIQTIREFMEEERNRTSIFRLSER